MLRWVAGLIGFLLPCAGFAQSPLSARSLALHATYETYAAGMQVAEVDSAFSFDPRNYRMSLRYHTTGMVGLLFSGQQFDQVNGSWQGRRAAPVEFVGQGVWRGVDRLAAIDYRQGKPVIRSLVPPNADEREAVPAPLQEHSIDTLSALAELMHIVAETGRCETIVRTYDGRRAIEIEAHTVGEEILETNRRSAFAGKALRCDFSGRMLAGFKPDDNRERDAKPMHGTAWLASVTSGGPPVPVRMAFETKWFGDTVMYLTGVAPDTEQKVARGH